MLHRKRLTAIALITLALTACGGGQVSSDSVSLSASDSVANKDSAVGAPVPYSDLVNSGALPIGSEGGGSEGGPTGTTGTASTGGNSVLTPSSATIVNEPLQKPMALPSPTPPTGPLGGPPWPRDAAGNITQAFWESLPLNEWIEVPGTKLRQVEPPFKLPGIVGFRAILDAWSGASFDTKRQRLIFQGGGHSDYVGNEVLALNLTSMTVERIWGPDRPESFRPQDGNLSVDAVTGINLTLTNNPTGTHTYRGIAYVPALDATVRVGQATAPLVFHHDINDWDRRYHKPPVDKYNWQSGEAIPWHTPVQGVAYDGKWFVFNGNWTGYVVDFSRHTVKSDGQPAFGVIEQFGFSHPLGTEATSVLIPETGEFVVFNQSVGIPDVVIYDLKMIGRAGFSRSVELTGVRDLVYPKAVNWYSPWDQVGTSWVPSLQKLFVLENSRVGANRMLVLTRTSTGFDAQWHPVTGVPPGYSVNGVFGRMQEFRVGNANMIAVVTNVDENVKIIRVN